MRDGVVGCQELGANSTDTCVYVTDPNTTFVGKTVPNWDGIPVDNFLGIKYATFDERFAPSTTLMSSSGNGSAVLVQATEYGPECAQQSVPEGVTYAEDCLYLNIFRPNEQKEGSLSVMVWIHGGQWVSGAGSQFDGTNLAGSEDVVVVTINYRLGVFGYLPTGRDGSGGMNGLLDVVNALKWVKDYIGFFGGDPNKVTIFGESAGGINICFLSVCPQANGLFLRAIIQSGQCVAFTAGSQTPEQGAEQLEGVLQEMNCTSPPCTIEDLKSLTTEELLDEPFFRFYPTIDPAVFPAYPVELYREGKINPTDMIIGANTVDNGDILTYAMGSEPQRESWIKAYSDFEVLRNQSHSLVAVSDKVLNDIEAAYPPDMYGGSIISATNHAMGDMNFLCYSRELAAIAASKIDGTVFQYIFGHNTGMEAANVTLLKHTGIEDPYWSTHAADVPYAFGYPVGLFYIKSIPEDAIALTREVMARWANFAKSGNPQVTSNSSSGFSSFDQWEPVPKSLYDASSIDAIDAPYLNFTGEGGKLVEANKEKSDQCTAVIPAEPSYLGADVESSAAGVSGMMNLAATAGYMIGLLGFMTI